MNKAILSLLFVILLPSLADAQIFRRFRATRTYSTSSCPNGQCPTAVQTTPSPSPRTIQYHWQSPNSHWSHPGDTIQGHMTKVHGVDVSGRTGEELLAWHDAIHEMERYGRITTGKLPTPRKTRRVIRLVDACPF